MVIQIEREKEEKYYLPTGKFAGVGFSTHEEYETFTQELRRRLKETSSSLPDTQIMMDQILEEYLNLKDPKVAIEVDQL
jgi:hypothetical protein